MMDADEIAKLSGQAELDQQCQFMYNLGRQWHAYYQGLMAGGFTEPQAWVLTVESQKSMWGRK